MRLSVNHSWNVKPDQAREVQEKLREKWEGGDRLGPIRTVAGLDAAFVLKGSQAFLAKKKRSRRGALREANRAIGAVVLFRYPEMDEIERAWADVPLEFPYLPGFLSFREIPALLAALAKLRELPDLLFCDGQGYAHPRRMGLASHLGILLDRPTIGCAKSILIGKHAALGKQKGDSAGLTDGPETIGAALRTRSGVKPIYVSQGHRVSLKTAIQLTLSVCDGPSASLRASTRIPRPTREADKFVSQLKKSWS